MELGGSAPRARPGVFFVHIDHGRVFEGPVRRVGQVDAVPGRDGPPVVYAHAEAVLRGNLRGAAIWYTIGIVPAHNSGTIVK